MQAENFSLLDASLVAVSVIVALIMLRPAIRDAAFWRATVTPLASIIGSGFLIVAPLLANIAGVWSIVCIVAIVLLSFWVGSVIRFNILHHGHAGSVNGNDIGNGTAAKLERLSDIALAFAYVISVTFYVRLMSGFILTGVDAYTPFNANVLASIVLLFIGCYGWSRGLRGLERLEEYSVTIKLAVIVSLLLGLMHYDGRRGFDLTDFSPIHVGVWEGARMLAGMLLIVQGFETSKYLSAAYDAPLRARSMQLAQVLAGVIYIAFVALALPLMAPFTRQAATETAIIGLSANITLVLPIMLIVAATMSQFSAAIADIIGAGGVVEDVGRNKIPARLSYPVLTMLAVALMWSSHIFEVVTFASRAFAFYYLLQTLLATRLAYIMMVGRQRQWLVFAYGSLSVVLLWVVLFAIPVVA
ncbi:hypothetical protein G8770_09875 [Aestuariicella hydrocarbonica]|uniref:Uncharacterized protein n=1 Tax=Pseudomaricurvus hydrocarbonicus TaxID=1470433 RepID=A0A9E5JSP8_9GAMM|nr:hypothetical protein [Aestuariicella hydrocarbonica]NHO65849.1 hypothetical protein [Aestuariicella hydrocarbonica]